MDRFSEDLKAALSKTLANELEHVLAEMAEEAQYKEQAMRVTLKKLVQDITWLEDSRETEKQEWQREREEMVATAEAARHKEQELNQDAISLMEHEVKRMTVEREKERAKSLALEKEHKRVLILLEQKEEEDYYQMMVKESEWIMKDSENWARRTAEREHCTLSTVLTAAAIKQRLLGDLKRQAQKWMVSDESTPETSGTERTPMVFKTWMLREKWRKLQNNTPCLNDGLQSFCRQKEIEQIIVQNQTLQGEIDVKFENKIERLMAETIKKKEKISNADLKKKRKLVEKIKKELEKVHEAELKEKKRKEAKEKKEKEKLERKKAKEEGAETRQPRFSFWRKSSRAKENAKELNNINNKL